MVVREQKPNGPRGGAPSDGASETKRPDAISGFRRALEDYRDTVTQAWRHEDASFRVNQVVQAESLQTTQPSDYATYLEQQAGLARKLQDAWLPPEFHEAVNSGFSRYVEAIRAAWADMDPRAVTPAELAHISQLISQAAALIAIPVDRTSASRAAQ